MRPTASTFAGVLWWARIAAAVVCAGLTGCETLSVSPDTSSSRTLAPAEADNATLQSEFGASMASRARDGRAYQFAWTRIAASPDTRRIYLSSFAGDDSNDCRSEQSACRTPRRAIAQLRNGFPDHLLVRRGDVFEGPLATAWALSGRSAQEPIVIATYGTPAARPRFRAGHQNGFVTSPYAAVRHVRVMDMHFHAHKRDPADAGFDTAYAPETPTGVLILALIHPVEDVLIEGCEVSFFGSGVVVHNARDVHLANVRLRANNIHDSWRIWGGPLQQGYSQGVFASGVDGLLLEQNVIEHNGGLYNYPGDLRHGVPAGLERRHVTVTWFNHQVYADSPNRNVRMIGNIIANGDGAQLRSGGVAEFNLFVRAIQSLTGGDDDDLAESGGYAFSVRHNMFLEGTDFPPESATPGPRAVGVRLTNVSPAGAQVTDNTFLRDITTVRLNGPRHAKERALAWPSGRFCLVPT